MSKKCVAQKGGSAYVQNFYANTAIGGPAAISAATLEGINNAPMFQPLNAAAVVPGNSSGIIPTGLYLASLQSLSGSAIGQPIAETVVQSGGAPYETFSTRELRTLCNVNGMSCKTKDKFMSRPDLLKLLKQFSFIE